MSTVSHREQRLYGAAPGGAELLDLHPALGSASGAINTARPGVYEGLRTFDRTKYFGLKTHLKRLQDSVQGFREPLDYDEAALIEALDFVARDAGEHFDHEARVRVDVAAAPAVALGTHSNILLAVTPFPGLPKEIAEGGAYLRSAPGLARPFPGVKTSDFIPLREAWITAHGDPDAYEHVMINADGAILEGTQSNVVLIKDGALVVPPAGVLPGVTQRVVLALAREQGMEVREEFTPFSEVGGFDEAFMTTSVRSVVPVSRIDEWRFPAMGPVTKVLSDAYDAFSAGDARPARENSEAQY